MNENKTSGSARITPLGALFKVIGIIIIVLTMLICLVPLLLPVFGVQTANIVSGSMTPAIPVGSLVAVTPGTYEELEQGEIIMYELNGTTVTHRVVSNDVSAREVVTKGDANDRADMLPVSYDQIEGIVRFHVPVLGSVLQFISKLYGKLVALGVLAIGVIMVYAGDHMRRRTQKDEIK